VNRPVSTALVLRPVLALCALISFAGCALTRPPERPKNTAVRSEGRQALKLLRGGEFFTYQGTDGSALGGFRHKAKGPCKQIVVALHGLQTHAGWMAPVATRLAAEGMDVWCPDRRGSGVNAAGHFASGDLPDWRLWVNDLSALVAQIARSSPTLPIVLVGYSWGGVTVAAYLADQKYPESLSQAVCIAPGWASQKPGTVGTVALLGASLLGSNQKIYLPTPSNVAVTALGRAVLWEDEVLMRQVTLRYLRQMYFMQQSTVCRLNRITLPFTLLLAGEDKLIANEKVEQLAKRLGPALRHNESIAGVGHLLVQEHPEILSKYLINAIKQRNQTKTTSP
jgi:alpha-beta hydrolase superfamily lysophospholipase